MSREEFVNLVTPQCNTKFGAPLGRGNMTVALGEPMPKTYTRRVPLDKGGYDPGGAYWGLGDPLYATYSKCGSVRVFHRTREMETFCKREFGLVD